MLRVKGVEGDAVGARLLAVSHTNTSRQRKVSNTIPLELRKCPTSYTTPHRPCIKSNTTPLENIFNPPFSEVVYPTPLSADDQAQPHVPTPMWINISIIYKNINLCATIVGVLLDKRTLKLLPLGRRYHQSRHRRQMTPVWRNTLVTR